MDHVCGQQCEHRADLDAAAAALAEASRQLSKSIMGGSDEMMEVYYAQFRAAKAKFCGARAAFWDHLTLDFRGKRTGGLAA